MVTINQLEVLRYLKTHPNSTAYAVSKNTCIDEATCYQIFDSLKNSKYINAKNRLIERGETTLEFHSPKTIKSEEIKGEMTINPNQYNQMVTVNEAGTVNVITFTTNGLKVVPYSKNQRIYLEMGAAM